jgi:hypothetical protein
MASATRSDPFSEVRHYVRERSPGLNEHELDDVTGEAIKLALESNSDLADSALTSAAQAQVEALLRQRQDNARRGHRVSNTAFREGARERLEPHRRKRAAQTPRTPKGVVPIKFQDPVAQYVPTGTANLSTGETMLMAHRISRLLVPVSHGEPCAPELRQAIERMFHASCPLPVEQAWAEILLDQIEQARLNKLKWEAFLADKKPQQLPEKTEIRGQVIGSGTATTLPGKVTLLRQWGNRQLLQIDGQLEDGRPVQGYLIGTLEAPTPPFPHNPEVSATRVLCNTISEIGRWPAANRIPDYLLDVELISWLVERMGFEGGGGGGAGGTISRSSITKLVVDPSALAAEIEKFSQRVEERCTDEEARVMRTRFQALAERIRARSATSNE